MLRVLPSARIAYAAADASLPHTATIHMTYTAYTYAFVFSYAERFSKWQINHSFIHSFLANVTTLRSLYAIAIPSVCLSVCRLSLTLVRPTQPVKIFGNFFHHTIAQELWFSDAKNRWWGRPFPLTFAFKVTNPLQTAKFRPISAHSASTVIASEKSSISTYRKSTTRFPTSHR